MAALVVGMEKLNFGAPSELIACSAAGQSHARSLHGGRRGRAGRRETAESDSDGEQRGGGLQEAAHELPAGLGIYSEAIAVAAVAGTRQPSGLRLRLARTAGGSREISRLNKASAPQLLGPSIFFSLARATHATCRTRETGAAHCIHRCIFAIFSLWRRIWMQAQE